MHLQLATALVAIALVASVVLVVHRSDRLFPVVAAVTSLIEALIVFGFISLSSGKFRIDVILPAVLTVAAGVCWVRSSTKAGIAASTAALLVGAIQLLFALRILH